MIIIIKYDYSLQFFNKKEPPMRFHDAIEVYKERAEIIQEFERLNSIAEKLIEKSKTVDANDKDFAIETCKTQFQMQRLHCRFEKFLKDAREFSEYEAKNYTEYLKLQTV